MLTEWNWKIMIRMLISERKAQVSRDEAGVRYRANIIYPIFRTKELAIARQEEAGQQIPCRSFSDRLQAALMDVQRPRPK